MNAAEFLASQWLVSLFARAGAYVASDAHAGMMGGCKCRVEGPTEDLVGSSRSGIVHRWALKGEGTLGILAVRDSWLMGRGGY